MLQSVPDVYLMGGPNGAGKTTAALRIFPALGVTHFINADAIAQGLSPLDVAGAARAAGRLMLEQMEMRLARGDDFALESTLASRSLAPFIERCKAAGYNFTLIYVWLRDEDLAVQRVESGGHDIPDDVIRRRYERGRRNFFELYQPLADEWSVWNNSERDSVEIARGTLGTEEILQPDVLGRHLKITQCKTQYQTLNWTSLP